MRKSVRLIGLVIFLSLILTGGIVFATGGTSTVSKPGTPVGTPQPGTTPQPQVKCCIAGEYKGVYKDTPSKSCPKPEGGNYTMVIYQDPKCGSEIKGKVTGPDGVVQEFKGTVTPGPRGCCTIQGVMKKPAGAAAPIKPPKPAEETKIKGVLCKKDGKWSGKGDYTNKRDGIVCSGKWEMSQI